MKLRPYQQEALDAIRAEFADNRSTLLVLPTGTGKTIVFAHLISELLSRGRAMVIAHRAELIYQAVDKLREATEIGADIEMADMRADAAGMFRAPVVVSTIQSQIASLGKHRRFHKFDPCEFGLLVIDEAHHATAASYRHTIEHYQQHERLRLLGVTATPDRHDEAALGQIFETVAYEYALPDAIYRDGWLVPIEERFCQCKNLDFSQCRTTAGDLNGADLAKVMEERKPIYEILGHVFEVVQKEKVLLFAASIKHATLMCEIINEYQPGNANIVTGKTPRDERAEMLAAYNRGDFQYLCNVGVATEGFDILGTPERPGIEVIVQARPTKSRALYAQMIGRGTRTAIGVLNGQATGEERIRDIAASRKPKLLTLDFVGNSGHHKLVTALDILGGEWDDEIPELATRELQKSGKPTDAMEALRRAERQAREARRKAESQKRAFLKPTGRWVSRVVDPFDLLDIAPYREKAWDKGYGATEKQLALLDRWLTDKKGKPLYDRDHLSKRRASQLIGELITRSRKGLCTPKMVRVLKKYYGEPASAMTMEEGRYRLDKLAANNWRRP